VQVRWGNPHGLKIRAIGERGTTSSLRSSPSSRIGIVCREVRHGSLEKHALIFQEYDELLLPSEIIFDRMDIWVKILNVPLGWMNETRGTRAMGLIGKVKKMYVDKFRKASGLFLRACVTIDVNRPLRRGVLLKTKKTGDPDWFDIQYEKLPYYCMSYGVMGHSELQCALPIIRNELGKLPYDVKL
jgi:hypothetical protein